MNCPVLLVIGCLFVSNVTAENVCGDWEPYKEEKCIKLFNSASTQSFADAEKICSSNDSKLITIHFHDDQTFLEQYLFTKKSVVDNIWLGAKNVSSDAAHVFHWSDGSNLTFTNWASGYPRAVQSAASSCVQMNADDPKGKWLNEPCAKRNLVVCERRQRWTLEKMQEMIEKLAQLRQQQDQHEKMQKLVQKQQDQNKVIEKLAQSQQDQTKVIEKLVQKLQDQTKEIDKLTQSQQDQKKIENSMSEKLEQLKKHQNSVPLGFIYVQLPKESSPQEIWPSPMSWTDISAHFDSTFFRVAGSKAAAFGTVQQEFSPYIDQITHTGRNNALSSGMVGAKVPRSGGWTDQVLTALVSEVSSGPSRLYYAYNSYHFAGGEVRPRNMAVRVWKRTG